MCCSPSMQVQIEETGWIDSRADPCADPYFLSGEGDPGPTARIQDPHMGQIRTYIHTYIHTYACTKRHLMFVHRQTDRHTCTCIDGKLKYIQIIRNCIIMYRDNVRNMHARAYRGKHASKYEHGWPFKSLHIHAPTRQWHSQPNNSFRLLQGHRTGFVRFI